jgi:hypothetical protein
MMLSTSFKCSPMRVPLAALLQLLGYAARHSARQA